MADLSLLFSRGAGSFTADARFDARDPAADLDEPPAPATPATPPRDLLAEAHATGFAEARAQALAQAEAATEIREKLGSSFARLDADLAEALRQRLLATVVALCEATLAPLAIDMAALARRVQRATAMFARADDERTIRLHPDDLAAVQAMLPPDWHVRPDPLLERGALRVETPTGGVEDGPAQWRQAITEALDLC